MKMKQIEVTIMGQSYLLGCPPGGDAELLEAVRTVDREMTAIKEAGRVKARERIAVLSALNLAYALAGRPNPALASEPGDAPRAIDGTAGHQPSIDALVRRLDQALHDDGRLI